jgi:hypothetical protein
LIPSAYGKNKHSFVYGGVNMNARMIPGGAAERSMGINSLPPRGGSSNGGSRGRPYYVEGMTESGQRYGTAVGTFNNNQVRTLDVAGCIRDQYNQRNYRPDVAALWRTYVGYTDVHHYTRHLSGGTHFHYTNGWTNCTTSQGTTPYRAADAHRCNT